MNFDFGDLSYSSFFVVVFLTGIIVGNLYELNVKFLVLPVVLAAGIHLLSDSIDELKVGGKK